MEKLAILGASGHGKVVAEIAELNHWHVTFFDDAWPDLRQIGVWEIIGTSQDLLENRENFSGAIVAIGNNQIRFDKSIQLQSNGIELVTLIHPMAIVSKYAQISLGTVVMAGSVVNPFTKIGKGGIINTSVTVDHDCMVGDGVHISPGANLAGAVSVGNLSWIGIGATVKQCVAIGNNVIIGAGSVVVKNVSDDSTVMGVPAR